MTSRFPSVPVLRTGLCPSCERLVDGLQPVGQNPEPPRTPPGRKPHAPKTGNKHVFGPPGPSPDRRRHKNFGLENILRQKKQKTLNFFSKSFQKFSKSFWSDFPDRSRSHPGSSSSEPTAETGFRCSSSERRAKRHRFERRKQQIP